MVKLEKENSITVFSTTMENAPQQSYEGKEIKGAKFTMKKGITCIGERAPLSSIDPNKYAQLAKGTEQKAFLPIKQIAKKQRINNKEKVIKIYTSNENNESCDTKRSPLTESSTSTKEIRNITKDFSEEEEYSSASIFLSPAKPVIDPNDSVEYENELKMLEEFYQAKSLELKSLSAPCPTYGQSFTEEEDEEYFYGEGNCEESEVEREEENIYKPNSIHHEDSTRNGPKHKKKIE